MNLSDIIAIHGSLDAALECEDCKAELERIFPIELARRFSVVAALVGQVVEQFRDAIKSFESLTGYLLASDLYAAAGYPLGKSWRGRNKWMNRYERKG